MTTSHIALIAGALVIAFWMVGAYNRLVRLRGALAAAWTPVDAQLRRRQALAFELAELLAAMAAEAGLDDEFGRSTLAAVVAATRHAQAAADHAQVRPSSAGALQSLSLAEQVLEGALRPLRALIALRPSLRRDPEQAERVQALLGALAEADEQLAFVRRVFNQAVLAFNIAVQEWPTRLAAGLFGFRPGAALQSATPERGPDTQLPSAFGSL